MSLNNFVNKQDSMLSHKLNCMTTKNKDSIRHCNDTSCSIAVNRSKVRRVKSTYSVSKINLLKSEGERLHNRFAHISPNCLYHFRKSTTGINEFIFNKTTADCSTCVKAKLTRKPFTKIRERASRPCEIIHANVIHFPEPTFHRQNRYLLTVADDHTRFLKIFPIYSKSEVAECLDKALVNLNMMFYPQFPFCYLGVDNGNKFENSEVERILRMF